MVLSVENMKLTNSTGKKLPQLKNKGDHYSLKTLAECLLEERVQQGGVQYHNAVEDAKTTMKLYLYDEGPCEESLDLCDAD